MNWGLFTLRCCFRYRIFCLILAVSAALASCQPIFKNNVSVGPPHSVARHVELEDSLGMVTLKIPDRYDTFLVWINRSDCGRPCETQEYRYQPKAMEIHKESGFFYTDWPKDSVAQLTISHTRDDLMRRGSEQDTTYFNGELDRLKRNVTEDPRYSTVVFDTTERIGDRYFDIVEVQKMDSIRDMRVVAETWTQGIRIRFDYHLMTGVMDSISKNFLSNSQDLIRTIRIRQEIN